MVERIGSKYLVSNTETGEYSYVKEAGSKSNLERAVGHPLSHFKLDMRFYSPEEHVAVLVETKQRFADADAMQLCEYLECEKALHKGVKCIGILANTNDDKIQVYKSLIDNEHILNDETVLDEMKYYIKLFHIDKQNDREKVLKNTYALNELLHKMDIDERNRSQFVGTTLLYIKDTVKKFAISKIDKESVEELKSFWSKMSAKTIRSEIESVLTDLLDGSENKTKKVELLQNSVLKDQKVMRLDLQDWIKILEVILTNIYRYIDADSPEGQDILNLFFIAFNKYTGKADKNQAFTPDHITDFMCRVANVDRTKVVGDITCGSGSFLVQAMVKELADCSRGKTNRESEELKKEVKGKHIFGIEIEEKAYGLATTNMLIHGDGNSNIKFGDCFKNKRFIIDSDPDIVLMNPPYNAKPKGIPEGYKTNWGKSKDGKEDPTKGMVFIHFLSDVVRDMNKERKQRGLNTKTVRLAVLLPVAVAIGSSSLIKNEKAAMLENNTLDAVFTLPNEIFYPGASASACCMVFTLGKPHKNADGTVNKTFFGYYKEDGFKKKKNLGRVEQFDNDNNSRWKSIEEKWLDLYRNKIVEDGISAMQTVSSEDEWLCEAYMKTDYSKLCESDFQKTLNNYLAYQIKEGKIYES